MNNKVYLRNLLKGFAYRTAKILNNPYRKLNLDVLSIKRLKHLPPGPLRRHKMLNGTVHYINPQELLHAINEIFVDKIYKLNLSSRPYIIDCGANIGLSVIYLKRHYPDATILAFEPDDKNFELLSLNVQSFNLNNVSLRKEAVWNENTTISFSSEGSMSSRIDPNDTSANQIKATRLKDYLDRKVDFLKIDIEGAEYTVLKDIQECLGNVENMFLEYHGKFSQNQELVHIFDIIQKAGFVFYIKEAANVFDKPFVDALSNTEKAYDLQLNIFCFRLKS